MPVPNRSVIDAADLISSVTAHIGAVISNIQSKVVNVDGVPLNVSDEASLAALILESQNQRLLELLPLLRNVKAEVKGLQAEIGQPVPAGAPHYDPARGA